MTILRLASLAVLLSVVPAAAGETDAQAVSRISLFAIGSVAALHIPDRDRDETNPGLGLGIRYDTDRFYVAARAHRTDNSFYQTDESGNAYDANRLDTTFIGAGAGVRHQMTLLDNCTFELRAGLALIAADYPKENLQFLPRLGDFALAGGVEFAAEIASGPFKGLGAEVTVAPHKTSVIGIQLVYTVMSW